MALNTTKTDRQKLYHFGNYFFYHSSKIKKSWKWNLKFNHSKSKVLVVGQRIDKNRKWYLGNEKIDETDNYKYLGVYLSRNLKPTHHILKYLKENLENKLNGMVRILGKHGEFNRVEFGNALWTSVIRPCIAHGCSMWRPSSEAQRNLLQSIQYYRFHHFCHFRDTISCFCQCVDLPLKPSILSG
jgi:hypothetical protein